MWRSILFVPVVEERFIVKAAARGADGIALDLEASIVASRKEEARRVLPEVISRLSGSGPDILVRINTCWRPAVHDLEAAVQPGVSAILLPDTRNVCQVLAISEYISELESARGLSVGSIGLYPLIESAEGITNATAIAVASQRIVALSFGVEDYVADLRADHDSSLLTMTAIQIIQAARAAGVPPMVAPMTLANLKDMDSYEAAVVKGKSLGSEGFFAVHPNQVARLNRVYTPDKSQISWAKKVITAAADAETKGLGVAKVDGDMIDRPLIRRAERILKQADADIEQAREYSDSN